MKLQVARTYALSLTEAEAERLCALLGATAPDAGLWDVFTALDLEFTDRELSFSDLFEVRGPLDAIEIYGKCEASTK